MFLHRTVLLIAALQVSLIASCELEEPTAQTFVKCAFNSQEIKCGQRNMSQGVVVRFGCADGFEIPSNYSDIVECLENEIWSQPLPPCDPVNVDEMGFCQLPEPEAPTSVNCSLNNQEIECGENMPHGAVVQFGCAEGFQIPTNYSDSVQCLENGDWSPSFLPKCDPAQKVMPSCILPEPKTEIFCSVNSQEIECGPNMPLGAVVQFRCAENFEIPTNYSTSIQCLENGDWSDPIPTCVAAMKVAPSCFLPRPKVETSLKCSLNSQEIECGPNMPQGAVVQFGCVEKFEIPANYSTTTLCLENGNWSEPIPPCCPAVKVDLITSCKLPKPTPQISLNCSLNGQEVECGPDMTQGAVVHFGCTEMFAIRTNYSASVQCLDNGKWSHPLPRCVPECGRVSGVAPLILNGKVIDAGMFPWQAAIYHKHQDGWQFACGGNLLSARMVLTAAHCVWQVDAKNIKVALGKRYREENATGESPQIVQVFEAELLESYQDSTGNYNGDLALLLLNDPVEISTSVSPVCIDWDLKLMDKQLVEGNTGVAIGWGRTEYNTFSHELRAVRLPIVSDEHCIQQQQHDFKKYVTYTTFCAGFSNGTGVCNGDSGGGLSFYDEASDTWYLQGIVSLSPTKRGTPYCDPSFYPIFTKVAMFTAWLERMEEREIAMEIRDAMALSTITP